MHSSFFSGPAPVQITEKATAAADFDTHPHKAVQWLWIFVGFHSSPFHNLKNAHQRPWTISSLTHRVLGKADVVDSNHIREPEVNVCVCVWVGEEQHYNNFFDKHNLYNLPQWCEPL